MTTWKFTYKGYYLYILVFLLVFPLTYFYPRTTTDDYEYAFSWKDENKFIETASDFFESEIAHYTTKNGRIWTNGATAFFSCNDIDPVFKLLNAIVFVLVIFFMTQLVQKHEEEITPFQISILFFLFWFLCPVPGETWLWMCGAHNYLWVALLTLACLNLLKQSLSNEIRFKGAAFIFCIFCGWQNEAFATPVLGGSLLYCLVKKPQLPKQTIWLGIGYAIGCLCLLLAPGTISRAGKSIFASDSLTLAILFRIYTLGMLFLGLKLKATILAIILLICIKVRDKAAFKQFTTDNLWLILTICCGIAFMSFICYVEERGLMGIELFSIILIYKASGYIRPYITYGISKWKNLWMSIILLIFVCDYSYAIKAVYRIHKADQLILSAYLSSEDGIVCSPLKQQDYDNRFVFYCNDVKYMKGITQYYHYHTGVWKPFHLIPKPYYDAMTGKEDLLTKLYKVKGSNSFYQCDDENYYFAKQNLHEGRKRVSRTYRFQHDGFVKKLMPGIATRIEKFYSQTNLQITRIEKEGSSYVFVNKLKRMLPELELEKIDFEERRK